MIPMAIMLIEDEDDKEFVKRLFLENETAMFIVAYRLVHDYHIARDMVSESCVAMIEKIRYLREIDRRKQTSYLISIAKNNSLMYLRRRKRERSLLMEGQQLLNGQNTDDQQVDSKLIVEAEMQMVHEALSRIHHRDRELLQMKYFEKLSDAIIAERLGIGVDSVRYYLTKARRNLENELKRRERE